jgi:hypothetical protein
VGKQATHALKSTPRTAQNTPLLGRAPYACHTQCDAAAIGVALLFAWLRGIEKEAEMSIRRELAQLQAGEQSTSSVLLLVALLLLVLFAVFALVANTPWVLDQPMSPYNWALVP